MSILFANNATTIIAGSIDTTSTQVNVAPGTGVLFPSPLGGDYFSATFYNAITSELYEIVHVIQRIGDQFTIIRAQEGTQAQAWSAGDTFSNLITAGVLGNFLQTGIGINNSIIYDGTDIGTANNIVIQTLSPTPGGLPDDGMLILTKKAVGNTGPVTATIVYQSPLPVLYADGRQMDGGDLPATVEMLLANVNGTAYRLVNTAMISRRDSAFIHVGQDTGAVNSVIATTLPTLTAYADGMQFNIKIANSNTGATLANFNNLGSGWAVRPDGTTLQAGDLLIGQEAIFIRNGGKFNTFAGGMFSGTAGGSGGGGGGGTPPPPVNPQSGGCVTANSTTSDVTSNTAGNGQEIIVHMSTAVTDPGFASSWSGNALTVAAADDGTWALSGAINFIGAPDQTQNELSVTGPDSPDNQFSLPWPDLKLVKMSNVTGNTLQSIWNGSVLTVAAAEAGLWTIDASVGFSVNGPPTASIGTSVVSIYKNYGTAQQQRIGYQTLPPPTPIAPGTASGTNNVKIQTQLNAGDQISVYASCQGVAGNSTVYALTIFDSPSQGETINNARVRVYKGTTNTGTVVLEQSATAQQSPNNFVVNFSGTAPLTTNEVLSVWGMCNLNLSPSIPIPEYSINGNIHFCAPTEDATTTTMQLNVDSAGQNLVPPPGWVACPMELTSVNTIVAPTTWNGTTGTLTIGTNGVGAWSIYAAYSASVGTEVSSIYVQIFVNGISVAEGTGAPYSQPQGGSANVTKTITLALGDVVTVQGYVIPNPLTGYVGVGSGGMVATFLGPGTGTSNP